MKKNNLQFFIKTSLLKNIPLLLMLFFSYPILAQFNISGIVIDNTSESSIAGAYVTNLESGNTVITNEQGKFKIDQVKKINVRAPGYQTKEILITQSNEIIIRISPILNTLGEVIINSPTIPIAQKFATDAIAIVSEAEIRRGNNTALHPILNRVPGVFMQSGTLNTNRITIRGIGARNLFGTANIRTFFGDIPLTDGNGESSIEDLELASLSSMEIHKGPSSSSYGVGLGGAIILQPTKNSTGTTGRFGSSYGSFGLQKNTLAVSRGNQKSNIHFIASNLRSDGYRDNNEYDRKTATLTSEVEINPNNNLVFLGSYINLKAGIPSSLNFEDLNENPRQAAFTWGRSKAFEDVDYGIIGITWKHLFSPLISQHTSVFSSFRNNYEPRPFNILKEKSNTMGIRTRTLGKTKLFQKDARWSIGAELFLDFYDGKTFQNLYEDFAPGTGSVRGELLSDLNEKRNYYNVFAETNYHLNSKLRVNLGLHLNQTFFTITDRFLDDNDDSSGNFDFKPILSPKIGMNYSLDEQLIFFGNISHGFSTPTTAETLLPSGEFNPDIKPEIGWNFEVGTRFNFLDQKLFGSLSAYTLRIEDLLVTRRTVEDNFFAINAGKTTHNGIELDMNYALIRSSNSRLNLYGNASVYDFRFQDFVDLDQDFSGNDLTGVPAAVYNLGIQKISHKGFYGNFTFQSVGEIPANDANTVFSESYELFHGKIGFINPIGKNLQLDLYLGANNIFDTKYVSQLQINARGFGGNPPRYFYPGVAFNAYGGINITYRM